MTADTIVSQPDVQNSVWYGSALVSLLVSAEATGGRYSLVRVHIQRAFTPAPHRHGPEAFYILKGQLRFEVGDREIVAKSGDFVDIPPQTWHTFTVESEEAEYLIICSPPGIEQLFFRAGKPAESLQLPAGRVGPPDLAKVQAIASELGIEVARPGTSVKEQSRMA